MDFELTPNAFTRTEYTFTGWNTNSDASGRPYADGQPVRNLSGQNSSRTAVYLYAQWQANPYTIRYDANGGQGSLPDTAAVYGTSLSLPDSAFTNSEGVFLGWSRTPDAKQPEFFAGQSVRDLSAEAGAVVTLYAVWMSNQEIQQGYQDQLNALYGQYNQAEYYSEDWAALTQAKDTAAGAITTAGSDQPAVPALTGLEEQLTALDETVRFYCDPAAVEGIADRARLARSKADAVQAINALYDELSAGWTYTPENQALLGHRRQAALTDVETAESTGRTAALLSLGKASLEFVDPIPKDPAVVWPAAAPLTRGQTLPTAP